MEVKSPKKIWLNGEKMMINQKIAFFYGENYSHQPQKI
jgi:hypothetical protein